LNTTLLCDPLSENDALTSSPNYCGTQDLDCYLIMMQLELRLGLELCQVDIFINILVKYIV